MFKLLGILLPYVIIVLGFVCTVAQLPIVIASLMIAVMIGLWLFAMLKSDGTILMRLGSIFNIVINVIAVGLAMYDSHLLVLNANVPLFILIISLQCVGCYILYKNKPPYDPSNHYLRFGKKRRYY